MAREVFDADMRGPNQLGVRHADRPVTAAMLLEPPHGTRTAAGLRHNIRVGVQYLEAWLRGLGCVPLYHLMEDAATAEICRTQIWQWIRHGARLEDGREVTRALVTAMADEELAGLRAAIGADRYDRGRFTEARALFDRVALGPALEDFLTLPAYDVLGDS